MRSPALTAATRFGLGPTRGAGPTREDLAAQLDDPAGAMIDGLDDFEAIRDRYLVRERAFRQAAIANRQETSEAKKAARVDAIKARRDVVRDIQLAEIGARYAHGVTTRNTFLERLVLFWSNHFAVEAKKVPVRVTVGNFERRAIRANVTGWFADMLKAAVTHPAMLFYLDNNASFGPNSMIGQRRGKSRINENLARELLELHTLGAGGGYTQADVNALALTLTGWTGGLNIRQVNPTFDERWHDHGPRTILGKTYTVEGEAQLHAVLDDLAAHPSTAINVATKFARHFVGDDASEALIEALRDSFTQSRGDLWELSYTLIAHPDAWAPEAAKAVPPYDFMVSVGRALGARRVPPKLVERATRDLGQPIWDPPSPAGWSYFDNDFLGGDSLLERVDFVRTVAQRFGKRADARKLARTLLGADLDPFVAETVDRAEDRDQALVLLLMSPAFQRR